MAHFPNVIDIEEQLAGLPFELPNGEGSNHFFDFRVTFRSGMRVCVSIKEDWEAESYKYKALFEKVRIAAEGNICDRAITISGRNMDPVLLHNAELFHAARFEEPDIDEVVYAAAAKIAAPVQISEFLQQIGIGPAGVWSVARAIRFGYAKLFNVERINANTLISGGRDA